MKLIEAEKAKDVIHEYFKSLMAKDASGADIYKLAVGIVSCLEHDANLLKAIDELPPAEQDTTTHDSIPVETGKNDGDGTSGDCISRTQAIDALKEKVFHNLSDEFYGAMQVLDELPSVQQEIIRCKDCKYCEHWYADKGRCFLWHESGIDVFEEGFCNYAERRTNG